MVREREKDMFDDIELNADLLKSCKKDIDKYCKSDFEAAKKKNEDGKDPEGIVYSCLIDVFTDESKSKVKKVQETHNKSDILKLNVVLCECEQHPMIQFRVFSNPVFSVNDSGQIHQNEDFLEPISCPC